VFFGEVGVTKCYFFMNFRISQWVVVEEAFLQEWRMEVLVAVREQGPLTVITEDHFLDRGVAQGGGRLLQWWTERVIAMPEAAVVVAVVVEGIGHDLDLPGRCGVVVDLSCMFVQSIRCMDIINCGFVCFAEGAGVEAILVVL
jgi:hypothetical protein